MSIQGRRCVVVGVGTAVGSAIARLFFASGARQVLVEDESAQGVVPAQSVADQVGSPLVGCTYGNRGSAKAVVRTAVEMLDGALDVLVLAAEANYSTGASDQSEDEWAEILRV
ncbi:uncharacterized protein METZ01_LOCUS392443, partial [marine metagenome]